MGSSAPRALRDVVAAASRGRLLGVEREYEVQGDDGPLDARTLWPAAADALGAALDPGDRNARRCGTGGVVTTDGRHAEIATSPAVLAPGCTALLLGRAAATEQLLRAGLGGRPLVGYSTHLNLEVDDRRVVALARRLASRSALPLMLALDRRGSPGLLVRPRPGRLEIGGEFATGSQLQAALVWLIGTVLLAERRWRRGQGPRVAPVPAVERFGWYLDRRAFGPDLYAAGRTAVVGGVVVGDLLRRHWERTRPAAAAVLAEGELALVDDQVDGRAPLPCEHPSDDDGSPVPVRTDRHYRPRRRGTTTVTVSAASWWRAVLEVRSAGRTRWLTVPGRALDAVLDAVDEGRLDDALTAVVAGSPTGPGAAEPRAAPTR